MKRMMTNDTDFGPSLHKPFLARMCDHAGIVSSALQNPVYWLLEHGCRVSDEDTEQRGEGKTGDSANCSLPAAGSASLSHRTGVPESPQLQPDRQDTPTLTDTYTDSE